MRPTPTFFERVVIDTAGRRQAVLDVIATAGRSLRVTIFKCDDRPVIDALVGARARGVDVEVLMTRKLRHPRGWHRLLRRHLLDSGIRVVDSPIHARYHAKFAVADDRIGLVATANLTARCFSRTSDVLVLTADPAVVEGLARLFEGDCGRGGTGAVPGGRLIVGPDAARPAFRALLAGAERSIRIADRKLRDESFVALLDARRAAGVDVRVLDGRRFGGEIAHGRLCIVDGRTAIVGSTGLASKSLDRGRELSIRLDEPAAVASLTTYFDAAFANLASADWRRVA